MPVGLVAGLAVTPVVKLVTLPLLCRLPVILPAELVVIPLAGACTVFVDGADDEPARTLPVPIRRSAAPIAAERDSERRIWIFIHCPFESNVD